MRLNIQALNGLMNDKCDGNYNAFARETGVNVSLLYKLLNGKAGAGLKTINRLIDYLQASNLNIEDYIFLP